MSCVSFPVTDHQSRDPASLQRCGWGWAVVQLCSGLTRMHWDNGTARGAQGLQLLSLASWVSFFRSFLSLLSTSPLLPLLPFPYFPPLGVRCVKWFWGGYIKEEDQKIGKNTMGNFFGACTWPPTIYLPWLREINWGQKDLYVPAAA